MVDEHYVVDDYITEREEFDERYGAECLACGQHLDDHDNDACNRACE